MCDHINHDTLDNREQNLRNVTNSQNQMNQKLRKDNKTGERCIYINKGRFKVQVKVNGKHVFAKRFDTLDEAIVERNKVIQKYHGEFAYIP